MRASTRRLGSRHRSSFRTPRAVRPITLPSFLCSFISRYKDHSHASLRITGNISHQMRFGVGPTRLLCLTYTAYVYAAPPKSERTNEKVSQARSSPPIKRKIQKNDIPTETR